ncbi:putative fungal specific transcription factor [Phaeomoniella chlamydospora]|uniref:Putative fungal specific transcription factor n=1 Tax=Phaeomoniella chlamydospora TaxID=158046 RepID=A0A0G2ELK9_PHACM|nr:putative fungal specific transcription factor [Phaeomoniella chlamydospora]
MSSPKTFQYDDRVLDPAIRSHIATLYAAVDKEDTLDIWGQHFTEDAELKKGAFHVKGRENLIALTKKSWSTQSSRDHIVYAVFPFGPGADEVMLHGRRLSSVISIVRDREIDDVGIQESGNIKVLHTLFIFGNPVRAFIQKSAINIDI